MSLYIESAVNGLRSFLVNWSSSLANTLLTRNELTRRDVPQEFIVGDEFQVNSYTTSDQDSAAVAALEDGDQAGAYGQLIDVSGSLKGNEFQINTYTTIEHVLSVSPNDPRFLNDEKHQVVGENSFFKPAPAPETQEKTKRKLSKEAKTLSMVGVGKPGSSF